jgi:hypothetical protein
MTGAPSITWQNLASRSLVIILIYSPAYSKGSNQHLGHLKVQTNTVSILVNTDLGCRRLIRSPYRRGREASLRQRSVWAQGHSIVAVQTRLVKETDMCNLKPPRHISTPPRAVLRQAAQFLLSPRATLGALDSITRFHRRMLAVFTFTFERPACRAASTLMGEAA